MRCAKLALDPHGEDAPFLLEQIRCVHLTPGVVVLTDDVKVSAEYDDIFAVLSWPAVNVATASALQTAPAVLQLHLPLHRLRNT